MSVTKRTYVTVLACGIRIDFTNLFDNKITGYNIVMVFKVKSAALDCCRLLSREKGGLNEAVTQVVVMDMDFISMEDTLIVYAILYNILFSRRW